MTIKLTTGDLLKERVDAIVNTVNTVGVMGKGIALQFKRKWPANTQAYEAACKRQEVEEIERPSAAPAGRRRYLDRHRSRIRDRGQIVLHGVLKRVETRITCGRSRSEVGGTALA